MVGTVRFTAIIATVHSLWCYGVSLLFFFAVFNVVPRISLDDPRNLKNKKPLYGSWAGMCACTRPSPHKRALLQARKPFQSAMNFT